MNNTVVEHVFSRLKDIGIDHVFGVAGDFAFPVDDAIANSGSTQWIGTSNELNAAYVADGYSLTLSGSFANNMPDRGAALLKSDCEEPSRYRELRSGIATANPASAHFANKKSVREEGPNDQKNRN